MQHESLRQAIAGTFPDRYTDEDWQSLLADFIELEMTNYLTLRQHYKEQVLTDSQATRPVVSAELRQATVLLARQGGIGYEQLALAYYQLKINLQATEKHNQHLYSQFTAVAAMCRDLIEIGSQAVRAADQERQRADALINLSLLPPLRRGPDPVETTPESWPVAKSKSLLDADAEDLLPPLADVHRLIDRLRAEEERRAA